MSKKQSRKNSCILWLPDPHFPFQHPDFYPFISAIKDKFSGRTYPRIDRVICAGDEVDGHSISFHEHDPDLFSPRDELEKAIRMMQKLYKMFPAMDLLESNHGSLVYRRGRFAGLPKSVFKDWREILGAPRDWHWHEDMIVPMSNGVELYTCHGRTSGRNLGRLQGRCSLQGHFHDQFYVEHWDSGRVLWDAKAGCLINYQGLAFAYARTNLMRPQIGALIIIDGWPRLIPMLRRQSNNRWTGKLVFI